MKYLTREQLKEVDSKSINEYGIPALILMENAGRAVADATAKLCRNITGLNIVIICGKGNNGSDGLVAARHLDNMGYVVSVILLDRLDNTQSRTAETATNLEIVKRLGIPIMELPWIVGAYGNTPLQKSDNLKISRGILRYALTALKKADVIIDAIFGIGLDRPIQGALADFIGRINELKIPIVAVDIPSGLDANTGAELGVAIKAKMTVTLGYPKIGFRNRTAKQFTGLVKVADISIPCRII